MSVIRPYMFTNKATTTGLSPKLSVSPFGFRARVIGTGNVRRAQVLTNTSGMSINYPGSGLPSLRLSEKAAFAPVA